MKSKITIAAMILTVAMCTSAHATTVLLNFTGSTYTAILNNTSYTIGATGVNCTNATTCGAATTGLTTSGGHGLGIAANPNTEILDNDYIVLDFSAVKAALNAAGATAVTFNLYETASGGSVANIYATNTNPILGASPNNQNVTQIAASSSATKATGLSLAGPVGTILTSTLTSSIYSYYVVDLTGASCGVVIANSGSVSKAPEPGTFMMAGMALVGLGITMKKRRKA